MHLSLIIPTLRKAQAAMALAQRVFELLPELDVEAIVVLPDDAPPIAGCSGLRVIRDSGRGVYRAYRAGLEVATGEYCWLLGDDDYPLDGVSALKAAILSGHSDLLVAPVIFSNGRIYRPARTKLILHFLNWCQQGVVYRRKALAQVRFFSSLPVQADQYVNILLRSNPLIRTEFFRHPICVFGLNGISGRLRDTRYASLRIALARRTLGTASYAVFRLLLMIQPAVKRIINLR